MKNQIKSFVHGFNQNQSNFTGTKINCTFWYLGKFVKTGSFRALSMAVAI